MPIMAYQLQQNALLPLLARAIVLNCGYNEAKNLYADPTGRENTCIRSFCAAKCLISWELEKASTIARERCGGGSYLLSSGIPEGVIIAHSGMTAEGDNRVLMQKIVKDVLADDQQETHDAPKLTMCPVRQIPALESVADFETLKNMIFYRETAEIDAMKKLLQKKIMEEGKPFFDVWMYEVSDEIQSFAQAFGERFMLQGALKTIEGSSHAGVKDLLTRSTFLYMLALVHKDQDWYMMNGVLSTAAAQKLSEQLDAEVKSFAPLINTATEGLGLLTPKQLYGPITRDYVAYNSQKDYENFESAGEMFDFRKTGMPRARL